MDRHVSAECIERTETSVASPRIAYFTSSFRPEMEAVASEVAHLRRSFPGSIAWGVSRRDAGRFSWRSGFAVPPVLQLAFRSATWLLQRAFHVNHLFGGLGDWFHLKAVGKRPTVMTIALSSKPCDEHLLKRVDRFAVEWPDAGEQLAALGVDPQRVTVIHPPVDLQRFSQAPEPDGEFTVLFASSPDRADWLAARGVDALLDAAALRRDIRFRLAWRPWGDSLAAVRREVEQRSLANVEILAERQVDMAALYQSAHVTAVPFRDLERCKPAPNSLIESLACGRPVITTPDVKLSQIVDGAGAGIVCAADGHEIAAALDVLQGQWQDYSHRARDLAEECFGLERFLAAYSRLYEQVL